MATGVGRCFSYRAGRRSCRAARGVDVAFADITQASQSAAPAPSPWGSSSAQAAPWPSVSPSASLGSGVANVSTPWDFAPSPAAAAPSGFAQGTWPTSQSPAQTSSPSTPSAVPPVDSSWASFGAGTENLFALLGSGDKPGGGGGGSGSNAVPSSPLRPAPAAPAPVPEPASPWHTSGDASGMSWGVGSTVSQPAQTSFPATGGFPSSTSTPASPTTVPGKLDRAVVAEFDPFA